MKARQERPLFSVVIPAYNAERFLAAAIDSALAQSYPPAEVIVVNDGSTDETLSIAQDYGSPVLCISQENRGVSSARKTGIEAARHNWIALLDSDDLWHADKLQKQADVILEHPEADLVYTDIQCFFDDCIENIVVSPPAAQINQLLMVRDSIATSSVVLSRAMVIKVGNFDPALRYWEDWELWVRFVKAGAQFASVSEPLTYYRRSPEGLSHQAGLMMHYLAVVVDKIVSGETPAPVRWWKRARMISRLESDMAILARETGHLDYFRWMLGSFFHFPLPLTLSDKRYRVALHMALTKLGVLGAPARQ